VPSLSTSRFPQKLSGVRIGIVGASVGGLSAALFLLRQGAHVTVFERSASKLEDRGGGIALDPEIIPLLGDFRHQLAQKRIVLGTDGNVLWERALRKCTASWSEIYLALQRQVPESIIHRGNAITACETDDEHATLTFENGTTERFDLVVGADGIGSTVRQSVVPEFHPRYLGYVAIRGHLHEGLMPGGSDGIRQMADTPAIVNCYGSKTHLVAYWIPSQTGRALNWMWYRNVAATELTEFLSDESGNRHHWSLPPGMLALTRCNELVSELKSLFPEELGRIAAATGNLSLQPIYSGVSEHFIRGRICLLGDAAHIAVPHIGAGSSFAIQDAHDLAKVLSAEKIEQSLAEWESQRRMATINSLNVSMKLGHSLQHEEHDWKNWSRSDFENWWNELTQGQQLYFESKVNS
jgi:2-polyprenyl-6-methoxyphenol hydroxylase-like FAD-dependent oxidoreductase